MSDGSENTYLGAYTGEQIDQAVERALSGQLGGLGQSQSGQQVPISPDNTIEAEANSEIFNDYAERTYETVANDGAETSVAATGNIATKAYSHAEGERTSALGEASHAEGFRSVASGAASHAEGGAFTDKPGPQATGYAAHAEGVSTLASGDYSHAEGVATVASGTGTHAEGNRCQSRNDYSHTEGQDCITAERYGVLPVERVDIESGVIFLETKSPFAVEAFEHIEINEQIIYVQYGKNLTFTVTSKNAESLSVKANGDYSGIESPDGRAVVIRGEKGSSGAHAEGVNCFAYTQGHAEGNNCGAWDNAHAEGFNAYAMGFISHAEGGRTIAYDNFCHAEGEDTVAWGECSHVEGKYSYAGQENSHVEGNRSASLPQDTYFNIVSYSEEEPKFVVDINDSLSKKAFDKLTVGTSVTILANNSNWEYAKVLAVNAGTGEVTYQIDYSPDDIMVNVQYGFIDNRQNISSYSIQPAAHAEGCFTIACGKGSHAEGERTIAHGDYSHAGGRLSSAIGMASLAHGDSCQAAEPYSVALGYGTKANAMGQVAIGFRNKESQAASDRLIVGKGGSNCFRVTDTGTYASGSYNSSGADYAELFEWSDGNPEGEQRIGRFVTLRGDKIQLAGPGCDYILGIVSGSPSVVGDVFDDQWQGMYLTDVYGRPIMEEVEVPQEAIEVPDPKDPEKTIRRTIRQAHKETRQKLNPDYDPTVKYIPRTKRPEWDAVGMLGKLVLIDDGSCQVDGYCAPGEDGVATNSAQRTAFRVIERLDDSHVRVLIK